MKQIITLLTILLFSQMALAQNNNDPYKVLWEEVQKLEKEVLTKSALKVVAAISKRAKKEKNSSQIIKALLYSSKYAMTLEEDAQLKIVNDFKKEIKSAEFPTKNVLESYLANLYWQYFQQNRWKFYNRTQTETKVDTVDFRTWDLTTLFEEINVHFEASLHNLKGLQKINVNDFKELLLLQKDSDIYRPTLFDLLAHSALNFYKTTENTITRPTNKFELNDSKILCEAYTYAQQKISSEDTSSLQFRALEVYQQLLRFHFPEPRLNALVEVDIERLRFIYQNALFSNKDEIYLEVLQNSAESLKHHEISALYTHEIARLYQQQGNSYVANTNVEHRWQLREALALCDAVIARFPDSRGADKCKALASQVKEKSLQLTTEGYIPLNTPARLLVNYKNHDALELSAHAITKNELKKLNDLYPHAKKLAFIKKLTVTKKWDADLKNENDYQTHSTEVLLPPLNHGRYLILATSKEVPDKTFAYSQIQVTNIALVQQRTSSHQKFQVIDRNNGKPISGAKVKLSYQRNYNGSYSSTTKVSDNIGMVSIALTNNYLTNVTAVVSHKGDKAHFGTYYIYKKEERQEPKTTYSCFLFTDRSIYRPGQSLYFKGIAIENSSEKTAVLENTSVVAELKDVNNQVVATKEFITNNYGSFSGEFILPNNGLTGNFSIVVSSKQVNINGYTSFSVEEYKRPKFETSFEPITETYKVNDSVTIKGKAMAFAGSAITDAKVSYTVRRTVYYPRWYSWYYPSYNSSSQEIVHGETVTDASGIYEINFKAVPDNSVDKKNLPTFSYEVTADVTDINGETHSTVSIVTVGYHTLTAYISVNGSLDKNDKENAVTISTYNLNGQSVPAKGELKIYKLTAPDDVVRPRPWAAPDYDSFGKTKFKELFPHDAYENEHDLNKWKKGALVFASNFDTGKSKEIQLGNIKKWKSGNYILELETKDKFGQIVKDIARTNVFSNKDKKLADNQLFRIKTNKQNYAAGDDVEVTLSSNAQDLSVSIFVEKDHQVIDTRVVQLNKNSKTFTVPIYVEDVGGFAITYSFSVYNSFQGNTLYISVPYPKTDLEIETVTFRDKLQPGADETWSFKIKGAKGDKVTAELLASMYDTSLDAFANQNWSFNPLYKSTYYSNSGLSGRDSYLINSFRIHDNYSNEYYAEEQRYHKFNWFGLHFGYGGRYYARNKILAKSSAPIAEYSNLAEEVEAGSGYEDLNFETPIGLSSIDKDKDSTENQPETKNKEKALDNVQVRKNLQETAFFFPQLQTDKEGNVSFTFTTPEALTKWRLQLLAHTKTLESAITTLETVTQKELMVIPNASRFLREGDQITFSTKIANLTNKMLSGKAKLVLTDAINGNSIEDKLLVNTSGSEQKFEVDSLGNTQVSWTLKIPDGIQAVQYKILAKAGDYSDGEQNVLPVLTNRMLVTETLPMWVRSNQTKTFVLEKLKDNTSTSLKHHKLTLEMTSNPAWYAVQALPYLMEYPYECNEQTFSKYYANTLASHIANKNPRIQEVFDQWANSDALISNLEKNQELKSLLVQETPWLRDAQSETEQKKRIALLFDLNKMKSEQAIALNKLKNNQMASGAWAWFKGGRENRFITQHIIIGLGHLKHLDVTSNGVEAKNNRNMIQKAIRYLDNEFVEEYRQMKRYTTDLSKDHLSRTQLHYLYMRSFFKDIKTSKKVDEITAYYKKQGQKYWMKRSLYSQGMLALILNRMEDSKTANKILESLEENSITSEELGMYWKSNTNSWYWYQAPIETQSLLIETFSEIMKDSDTRKSEIVDNLKIWLLKNKQTNQWKTTKATSSAVYALLLQGSDWLSVTDAVDVLLGGEKIAPSKLENVKIEAGTGYYKTTWNTNEVQPKMGEVQISKKGKGIAWGALYWQYFENLDKITPAETPLKLKKKLFLKKNTDTGEKISEITEKTALKVGDLVRVRIELRVDRAMEFVHMKDMRAAGLEPINVISKYKWQDGLGYYESTKDASTNFFFDYLSKGVYVFEYDLRVNNAGNFSNGITTIQSMYAPEFSSHSEGVRVMVSEQQ